MLALALSFPMSASVPVHHQASQEMPQLSSAGVQMSGHRAAGQGHGLCCSADPEEVLSQEFHCTCGVGLLRHQVFAESICSLLPGIPGQAGEAVMEKQAQRT